MNLYQVKITETLTMTVEIVAENELSAERQASDRWSNSEYILDTDNFSDVSFEVVSSEKDIAEAGFSLPQLYDYLSNWRGLIHENVHLNENEQIRAEHQKVLADACACVMRLENAEKEIAELKSEV